MNTKTKKAKPIVPWMGGKSRLAKKILPHFKEHRCYAEPFAGGASLFFAKEPAKVEVLNDVHDDLINLYRVVKYHLDAFIDEANWLLSSREHYEQTAKQNTALLTDIQRAVRFFYLMKNGFGGNTYNYTFGTATTSPARFNSDHLKENLKRVHKRLKSVYIESLHWEEVIHKYDRPHTLFYCDPPYWQTATYADYFPWQEYEKLREYMQTIKGTIILSINDHPDIRNLFAGCTMIPLETTYSTGTKNTKAKELLIMR